MPTWIASNARIAIATALIAVASACGDADQDPVDAGNGAAGDGGSGVAGSGGRGNANAGNSGAAAAGSGGNTASGSGGNSGSGGKQAPGSGGATADAGTSDGGAGTSGDAGSATCDGTIVDSQAGCLQDDAYCIALGDGRYCTGSLQPECPPGFTPIDADAECPDGQTCFQYSESLRCAGNAPTTTACGARAGDTCTADEYCAYTPEGLCGAADATAVCAPRPNGCDDIFLQVCGCDGEDYANDCEAAAAGTGVRSLGECP